MSGPSSVRRETRPFSFRELQIVFYGIEISWPVPCYLGLRRQRPGGGRCAAIASKLLPNPRASHPGQILKARHILAGLVDGATLLGGLQ